MRHKKRNIAIVIGSMIFIGILIVLLYFFSRFIFNSNAMDNQNDQKKEEMLNITLEWGRLAPLPDSIEQFEIRTDGGPFTRSFSSSFYIGKDDLDNWTEASPGLQDARVKTTDGTKKYIINPGGGAAYAEAEIDFNKCFVTVYVDWS